MTLVLLSIGIYGAVVYAVGLRTKEIAIRLALGARRRSIMWMVVQHVLGVLASGLALGVVGVVLAGRVMKPLLFGIAPSDPRVIAGAAFVLCGIAGIAAGPPARAAARLDPAAVLQE